jgi:hypothetical protein
MTDRKGKLIAAGCCEGDASVAVSKIEKRRGDADSALVRGVASVDQPVESMRKWAPALEYVTRTTAGFDKHEALIDSFCKTGYGRAGRGCAERVDPGNQGRSRRY